MHTSRDGHAHAHACARARTPHASRGAAHVWRLCARLTIRVHDCESYKRICTEQVFLFDIRRAIFLLTRRTSWTNDPADLADIHRFSSGKGYFFTRERNDVDTELRR